MRFHDHENVKLLSLNAGPVLYEMLQGKRERCYRADSVSKLAWGKSTITLPAYFHGRHDSKTC